MTASRWTVGAEKPTKPCMFCKQPTMEMVGGSAWIQAGRCCDPCYQSKLKQAIKDNSYYRRKGSKDDWNEYYALTR